MRLQAGSALKTRPPSPLFKPVFLEHSAFCTKNVLSEFVNCLLEFTYHKKQEVILRSKLTKTHWPFLLFQWILV